MVQVFQEAVKDEINCSSVNFWAILRIESYSLFNWTFFTAIGTKDLHLVIVFLQLKGMNVIHFELQWATQKYILHYSFVVVLATYFHSTIANKGVGMVTG